MLIDFWLNHLKISLNLNELPNYGLNPQALCIMINVLEYFNPHEHGFSLMTDFKAGFSHLS